MKAIVTMFLILISTLVLVSGEVNTKHPKLIYAKKFFEKTEYKEVAPAIQAMIAIESDWFTCEHEDNPQTLHVGRLSREALYKTYLCYKEV